MSHTLESFELRRLMAFDNVPVPVVDLRVDSNRDGRITADDNRVEMSGDRRSGALVLPNLDRDNTATPAPDNWTGGNWLGRNIPANNVIDNAADLLDLGRLRVQKLGFMDSSFSYEATLRLLKPTSDAAYYKTTSAQDRVRVFMPTVTSSRNRLLPQPGDAMLIGPGTTDTVRFVYEPKAPNEFPISMLAGDGYVEFAVEGLKLGAQVRAEWTVTYGPVIIGFASDGGIEAPRETIRDEALIRVAPFVLSSNTDRVSSAKGSVWVEKGFDPPANRQMRDSFNALFGDRFVESDAVDLWTQDGVEVGYAKTPTAQINIVLELPRALIDYAPGGQRRWVRQNLLRNGVGIAPDVALSGDNPNSYGGDIEAIPRRPTRAAAAQQVDAGNAQKLLRRTRRESGARTRSRPLPRRRPCRRSRTLQRSRHALHARCRTRLGDDALGQSNRSERANATRALSSCDER
ncbi:MAG: protein-arginine deiminase family protein [Tepidisphaeraceae bacterium]